MKGKYKFYALAIEVTRKCNRACVHCCRGESQNLSITKEIIDELIEQVEDCYEIGLTGGEPLLEMDIIDYIVEKIIESNWKVGILNLTTNGSILSFELISILNKFCNSADYRKVNLTISGDSFHNADETRKANIFYRGFKNNSQIEIFYEPKMLSHLTFSGRAEKFIEKNRNRKIKDLHGIKVPYLQSHRIKVVENEVHCYLQICSNGNVNWLEEVSYDVLDSTAIGNILDHTLFEIIQNNNNISLLCCRDYRNLQIVKQFLTGYNSIYYDGNNWVKGLIADYVYEKIYELRKLAQRVYPNVMAEDIILQLEMPPDVNLYNEKIIKTIDKSFYDINSLSNNELERLLQCDKELYNLYEQHNKNCNHIDIITLFLLRKSRVLDKVVYEKICKRDKIFKLITATEPMQTEKFQILSSLNDKYKNENKKSSNNKIFPCQIGETLDGKNVYDSIPGGYLKYLRTYEN